MAAWNSENKKAGKSENKIKLTKRDSESPEGTPKKKVKKKHSPNTFLSSPKRRLSIYCQTASHGAPP